MLLHDIGEGPPDRRLRARLTVAMAHPATWGVGLTETVAGYVVLHDGHARNVTGRSCGMEARAGVTRRFRRAVQGRPRAARRLRRFAVMSAMHRRAASNLSPAGRGRTLAIHGEGTGEGGPCSNLHRSTPSPQPSPPRGEGGPSRSRPLLAFLSPVSRAARAEVDHAAIARAALQDVIRPGFAGLAESADALGGEIEALCREPSAESIEDAKNAFASAVAEWSKVEILRFGPILQDHRYERLFYWPDPKGLARVRSGTCSPSRMKRSQRWQHSPQKAWRCKACRRSNICSMATPRALAKAVATVRFVAPSPMPSRPTSRPFRRRCRGLGRGRTLGKSLSRTGPRRSRLSHPERSDARSLQDLLRRHRVRARSKARQDARRQARAGQAGLAALGRSGLTFQAWPAILRAAAPLRQGRPCPGGAAGIGGRRELDCLRSQPRRIGPARD